MTRDLKHVTEHLPDKAGVYFFKNSKDEVIYIGKARSLKERVKSYFQANTEPKVRHIISETADIDYVLTGSEKEATLLENNFIRNYRPKYNHRLKDDKSFPYLKLTLQEKFPGIHFTRKVEPDGAKYFGPFSPAQQARRTILLVSRYFGIRSCEEPIPGKRSRPCLEYDLNLCSGPCVGLIPEPEYRENAADAMLFLQGRTDELARKLREKMNRAAERLEFEQAAHWRDILRTVEELRDKPLLTTPAGENMDIIGYAGDENAAAFFIFLMRRGKVLDSREVFLERSDILSDHEAAAAFLQEFYSSASNIPEKILLSIEPSGKDELIRRLSGWKGGKVGIIIPRKGKNKKLLELAEKNARLLLSKKRDEAQLPGTHHMEEIRNLLGLEATPRRIEGFDVSNTSGDESVGSLVVFENGRPSRDGYRKYKVRSVTGPNDTASLEEIIRRRYQRAIEEKTVLPDLVLVDGGKGQLGAALKTLQELGLEKIPVVSLAKKEEVLYIPQRKEGIRLERTSPALKLFQYIRDEAHRFAVTFHRRRRMKKSFSSLLDGIPGLGPKRKKTLLSRFKSMEDLGKASREELAVLVGGKAAAGILKALDAVMTD